jgi:hypothetical protein
MGRTGVKDIVSRIIGAVALLVPLFGLVLWLISFPWRGLAAVVLEFGLWCVFVGATLLWVTVGLQLSLDPPKKGNHE